ncbi:unnamed protein product [Lymnaea stagnalis]|uniref:EF-hand domain-containing protein n=1 Tax=Lymnaea stagnalis TaxID=6523 RepID=A0AAV2I3Z6_LYMST
MANVKSLLPESHGVQFTSRPALRTRESLGPCTLSHTSYTSSAQNLGLIHREGCESIPFPHVGLKRSSIEIEAALREKVYKKLDQLQKAFKMYDVDDDEKVTKDEFRRVLECNCMPLTSEEFNSILAKLSLTNGGTRVNYVDFLRKFHGLDASNTIGNLRLGLHTPKELNLDILEKLLKDKINANLRSVLKGLQMSDFNMDGKVQKNELRRVLENHCFKFTDEQYEKLWDRYDFQHTGLVNYQDFFARLGVIVKLNRNLLPARTAAGVPQWPKGITSWSRHNKGAAGQLQYQQKEDEKLIRSLTLEQIEFEFRKRMRNNYLKLKKTFMSFDKHLDGYVSIEDLKSILNSFTLPMSDELFLQLMERCGIRASGRVAWEIFLEKFQSPISIGNGQTIPIGSNYRIYPIMEMQRVVEWDSIWKQLYKRVQSHYNGLKEAFLQMDKNRDGRISRKEFRELIEKFTFRLDDKQFQELMSRIDPDHGSNIDYHIFLRLFEEKETKDGHKWLKSVHKYNDKPRPAILNWDTVEELLREKITYYWKDVSDWLTYHDRKGQGYMSMGTLKKILDMQVLPISKEHFENLITRCTDFKEGKVNYMEFLARLGVDVRPGDIHGVSSQIMESSGRAEVMRNIDLINRHDQMALNQCYRTSQMSADEVITRFKDKMSQLSPELRRAFLACDKQSKGHITKKEFRRILSDLGILMSDEQFSELMAKLKMHNGHMKYMDFIMNFGDPRQLDPSPTIFEHPGNHKVNPIRGLEYGMTAVDIEAKLRQKLRENFTNLREAFHKFDDIHKGSLDKQSFRRMLDSFMIHTTDPEYEKLCTTLGITNNCRMSYVDFLERFELKDGPDGHKWLKSVHRYNETIPPKPLLAADAHSLLAQKAFRQWKDLSMAFRSMDNKANGVITRKDLRETLNKFVIPMQPVEFKKLWARLDTDNQGFISHQNFVQRLGASEYASGDNTGTSHDIIDGSCCSLEDHIRRQQEKHEDITWHQANLTKNMPTAMVERYLRDKIRDGYTDFFSAFSKFDTQKCGSLSASDIQKVLSEQNLFIDDEQFFTLLDRIGLGTSKSRINYEDFLNAFEDGRKSSYGNQLQDLSIEAYHKLTPEEAEKKLKHKLKKNIEDITKALAAFDKEQCGKVAVSDFHRVLDLFCFVMTKPQWKLIKAGLNIDSEMFVHYNDYLSELLTGDVSETSISIIFSVENAFLAGTPNTLDSVDQATERIHEAVVSHYHKILRDFESFDVAQIGSVTAEEFKQVIARYAVIMNDEQFNKLWGVSPVNEFGNVDYKQFLKLFSEGMPILLNSNPQTLIPGAPTNYILEDPSTPSTSRPLTRVSSRPFSRLTHVSSRSASRTSTPMVNAENAEMMIKDIVLQHWQSMQKRFREMDVDNSGAISVAQFKHLLSQYGLVLSPAEFQDLVTKYDIHENGTFCYSNFMRHFVLTVKSSKGRALTTRERAPSKHLYQLHNSSIQEEDEKDDALRRTQECIRQKWKEMRRAFRNIDSKSQGVIPTDDFRKVLRQFNINLTENEFQEMQGKYDKNLTNWLNYNDFLKDHLLSEV